MKKARVIYILFMLLFFGVSLYFTQFSKVNLQRELEKVATVMPTATGQYESGRMTFRIPTETLHSDRMGIYYVLVWRRNEDALGIWYESKRIDVRVLQQANENEVIVDGIVWEEPILIEEMNLP